MDSWKRPPEAPHFQAVLSALSAADTGPGRTLHPVSRATTRPRPSPWPTALPGAGRPSQGGTCLQPVKGPENLISSSAPAPDRASGAGGGEVAAPTSCTAASIESAGKVFSTRAGVCSSPRMCGFGGSEAGGSELGPGSLGVKNQVRKSLAPQLSAGTTGPAPAAPPQPPLTEPLPAAAAAAAEVGPGSTLGAGTQGSDGTCLRARPPACLARPPTRATLGGRRRRAAVAVRGGGKGEQGEDCPRREARSSCSRKSPPSFPPHKRGDGGSSWERERWFSSATRRS